MADLVVSGRFLDPDGSVESPLSGRVVFTASVPLILEDRVRRARVVTARLDKEGFLCRPDGRRGVVLSGPGEGVEPSAWSWRVEFELTSRRGGRVGFDGFWLPASSGALDLRDATPVPDPDTGEYVVRGERGRDALMLAPDPVIRGLFVMVRGAVPVDAAGMIPVGPMLRSER